MDALIIVTLALFALMVVAWLVLPSAVVTIKHDEVLPSAAAPAAAAQ